MTIPVRTFLEHAISLLAAMAACATIFSFLASWLPLADSVAHFRFHLLAGLAVAAVILTVLRGWRQAGFAWAVSLAGLMSLWPALPFPGVAPGGGEGPSLTVVQLNLSFRNRTPRAVADFIRAEDADVVTLQEVTGKTVRVVELLGEDYPYSVRCAFARVGSVVVLSRLRKASGPSAGCAEGEGLAWLRVMADGRPVSVASLHLHWPYPFSQVRQIDRLEKRLRDIPRPVVVAGDFNAAPWSHAVSRVADATDTTVAGGLRFTFSLGGGRWAPSVAMPIDHILLPAGFLPTAIRAGPGPGSDHRSVVARLALPPGAGPDQGPGPLAKRQTDAR